MGPLAPAVYWRRRVAVVGALVVVVFSGLALGDHFAASAARKGRLVQVTGALAAEPGGPEEPDASAGRGRPTRSASPGASASESRSATRSPSPSVRPARPAPACSDGDLTVSAAVTPERGPYGGTFSLSLVVRNGADHECSRDLGSASQEIRVLRAGTVVWSSDDCGEQNGSDIRVFPAGASVRYTLQWNTYHLAPNACVVAAEPAPAGNYQVIARLAGKVSAPANFEIEK